MDLLYDAGDRFTLPESIKCQHCGFEHNPYFSNCCGKCGKSLRLSMRELGAFGNNCLLPGSERWKVYDSHKDTCTDGKEHEIMVYKYNKLKEAIRKERTRRDKKILSSFKNDPFLSELESILDQVYIPQSMTPDWMRQW